jgi:hypothetical protein
MVLGTKPLALAVNASRRDQRNLALWRNEKGLLQAEVFQDFRILFIHCDEFMAGSAILCNGVS